MTLSFTAFGVGGRQLTSRHYFGTRALAAGVPAVTARHRHTLRVQNDFVLIPKGDGSCDHLSKRVSLPDPIRLKKGLFELGREEPADIVLPIPTVSSRHAMIRTEDSRVTVTDLNSTNGTYINETELEPMKSTDVPVGAEVTFGDVFLAKFQLQNDSTSSNAAQEASAAAA